MWFLNSEALLRRLVPTSCEPTETHPDSKALQNWGVLMRPLLSRSRDRARIVYLHPSPASTPITQPKFSYFSPSGAGLREPRRAETPRREEI